MPTNCSASNSTVTCTADVKLESDDQVVVDKPTDWVLEGDTDLTLEDNAIVNDSGDPDELTIDVGGHVNQKVGAIIRGNLEVASDVTSRGKIEGRLRSGGDVVVKASVDFDPEVEGDIIAENDIVIETDARVVGDSLAGSLVDVKSGAELEGCATVVDGDVKETGEITCDRDDLGKCSLRIGEATINEVANDQGDTGAFIEVKIVDESIDEDTYEDWELSFETEGQGGGENAGTSQSNIPLSDFEDDGFPWLVLKDNLEGLANVFLKNGLEVRLDDASGNAIDYLSHRGFSGDFSVSCPFKYDTESDPNDNNPFEIRRKPDGTGDWEASGSGNSGDSSEGGSNDDTDDGGDGIAEYTVNHDGQSISCVAEAVKIIARDSNGEPAAPEADTVIDLSAAPESGGDEGDWVRLIDGDGTLSTDGPGSGVGSYTFPGDESQAIIAYQYAQLQNDPEDVILTVDDGEASGSSDNPLSVSLAGFRFVNETDGNTTIPNQISGKPSDTGYNADDLGLQAIRASEEDPTVCEGQFDKDETVTIGMAAECGDPDQCAGQEMEIGGTAIATSDDNDDPDLAAAYREVDLTFDENSVAPLVLRFPDAGRTRLYARYEIPLVEDPEQDPEAGEPSGGLMLGSSNEVVWRPFGFDVEVDTTDAENVGPTGDVFRVEGEETVAGEAFPVRLRAVTWDGEDFDGSQPKADADLSDNDTTPNFGNEEDPAVAELSPSLSAPDPADPDTREGTLSNATYEDFGADGPGEQLREDITWNEVGYVNVEADLDGDYLGTQTITGRAENVGRFIPDYLVQTVDKDGMFGTACGNEFTYIGQTFGYEVQPKILIEAFNAQDAITRNYQDDYARLEESGIGRSAPDEDDSQKGRDDTLLPVEADTEDGNLESNGDGTLTYTFSMTNSFAYTRNNSARGSPFEPNMTITIDSVEDKDGVTADAEDRADVKPMSPGVPASGIPPIRFGRLSIDSAVGSELKELPLPLEAQYWDGSTWIVNEDDECSTLDLATDVDLEDEDGTLFDGDEEDVPLGGGTTTLTDFTADSLTLGEGDADGGTADFVFTEPGAGNVGWVDVVIDLDAAGLPFLRDDLDDDDVFEENPEARASFGLFPGSANQIYREEVLR